MIEIFFFKVMGKFFEDTPGVIVDVLGAPLVPHFTLNRVRMGVYGTYCTAVHLLNRPNLANQRASTNTFYLLMQMNEHMGNYLIN